MSKEKILSFAAYTENNINIFLKNIKDKKHSEYSFTNWRTEDIVNHIAAWLMYSSENFRLFKKENRVKEEKDNFVSYFNLENYQNTCSYTKEKTLLNIKDSFNYFKDTVALYSEEELSPEYRLPAFPISLWQCMIIDIVIHPTLHIMYEYLKNSMYDSFIGTSISSEKYFSYYSEEYFHLYSFSEFANDKNEIKNYMIELEKYYHIEKNTLINEIIKINMQ